jgi:hypothetical protein
MMSDDKPKPLIRELTWSPDNKVAPRNEGERILFETIRKTLDDTLRKIATKDD